MNVCRWKWSAPASPSSLGEAFIKLFSTTGADVCYIRLTVAMNGSQRMLTLESVSKDTMTLPFRLFNDSKLLIALRQRESPEARWELLGAGEACEYSLDAPSKPHVLQLVACATDGSLTASWTEPADGEEGAHCLSLEKLDHLHEHAFAEKQGHPTSKLISLPLSAEGERTSEVDDISSPTCDLRSCTPSQPRSVVT